MRTAITNLTNRNTLANGLVRIVVAGKQVKRDVVLRARAFFARPQRPAITSYPTCTSRGRLVPVAVVMRDERLHRDMQSASATGQCWHSMHAWMPHGGSR